MAEPNHELNFLQGFLELCKDTEIPPTFAAWSGLSAVSCMLGRRSWLDMGSFMIFPNMYICLVAGSGLMRKSTSIGVAERMLRRLEPAPNLLAQKLTAEALIDALKSAPKIVPNSTKINLKPNGEGFVVVDELSTFLNKQSYEAGLGALLTPLYDCKDSFAYHTKGGGSVEIHNACLGLIGGATIDWLTNAVPEAAVGGGVTSRFMFVYEQAVPPPIPLPEFSEAKRKLEEALIRSLMVISTIEGEWSLTDETKEYFKSSYIGFRTDERGAKFFNNKLLSGYASRRGLHQLKLALVLSASESPNRVIELRHLIAATRMLESIEVHLPTLMALVTSSEEGHLITLVLTVIRSVQKISRQTLIKEMGHKIGVKSLDSILDTLDAMGEIDTVSEGSLVFYRIKKRKT